MADQGEQYEKSWILYHILDRLIGSPEQVAVSRKLRLLNERIDNGEIGRTKRFYIGSSAEGFNLSTSNLDLDVMFIDDDVIAFHDSSFPPESTGKTVCAIRDCDSRPGYVILEMIELGSRNNTLLLQSIVPVGDRLFVSSELYRRVFTDTACYSTQMVPETHGPASCIKRKESNFPFDLDFVLSIPCNSWPKEAYEWVIRPRLHGWPDKALRDEIVRGGCHLVPVGDKTSADTFLQWRFSFSIAEKKLMHSLSHSQFLIYGLLKHFSKQISHKLMQAFEDADIISSYMLKTCFLYAVESTSNSLWQEKNTFFCFIFCLNILIVWVNAGHFPNYFISNSNMFQCKVRDGNKQQKLLHFLISLRDMQWGCLAVGTAIQPSLGMMLQNVRIRAWELVQQPPKELEMALDFQIFEEAFSSHSVLLAVPMALLSKAKCEVDELLAYIATARALCSSGMDKFEKNSTARGNKGKYQFLKKCKHLLTPFSTVCTSPGQLTLATYHFKTGNYMKALVICGEMISSFKIHVKGLKESNMRYGHLYCGRGYTLFHKCKEVVVSNVSFPPTALQFCPSQLHPELTNSATREDLVIPPLPYAVFLTFLCYHELGDTRRRDTALIHLRAVKYDEAQGAAKHWIVHNLLGTCYEMVGDKHRALREYRDSLNVRSLKQYLNPARARIEQLQISGSMGFRY